MFALNVQSGDGLKYTPTNPIFHIGLIILISINLLLSQLPRSLLLKLLVYVNTRVSVSKSCHNDGDAFTYFCKTNSQHRLIVLGKLSEHLIESKSTAEWKMVIVLRHP